MYAKYKNYVELHLNIHCTHGYNQSFSLVTSTAILYSISIRHMTHFTNNMNDVT